MTEQAAPQFSLQRIYTKDLSFEAPNSPQNFLKEWKPDMNLDLNTEVNKIDEHNYEVVLMVTATVKNDGETAFLAEVHQAGVFTLVNIPAEQVSPIMGIQCPNILFPYAREAISDLVNRGSFPQLLLTPVNFEQLYLQAQQQKQQESNQGDSEQTH